MIGGIEMRTIPKEESLDIEFKSDLKCYPDHDLIEEIVGMTNTAGGCLFLGVEDDGTITGVHKKHRDPIGVTALIANSTVPPIAVRAEIITEEDKDVLKIASYSQDKILSHSMVPASNPHPSAEAVPGVLFSMY